MQALYLVVNYNNFFLSLEGIIYIYNMFDVKLLHESNPEIHIMIPSRPTLTITSVIIFSFMKRSVSSPFFRATWYQSQTSHIL